MLNKCREEGVGGGGCGTMGTLGIGWAIIDRWLDIGQVPLSGFIDRDEANIQPSWSNKLSQ